MKYERDLSDFERFYFEYQRNFARKSIDKYGINGYKDLRRKLRAMLEPDGYYHIPNSYISTTNEELSYGPLAISWLVCAANFQAASKSFYTNNKKDTYELLMAAIHACGVFEGFKSCKENINDDIDFATREIISDRAKKAALIRHSENHSIKADAMKYYADNIDSFPSMDSAAEQIAGKIVNAKFRTVRQWITEYHKNLRSAGTV